MQLKNIILWILLFIFIISSFSTYKNYLILLNNHNGATWHSFRQTKELLHNLENIKTINNSNDLAHFQQKLTQLNNSIITLELLLRNTTLSDDSVKKDKLVDLFSNLQEIIYLTLNNKDLNINNSMIQGFHTLSKLLKVENGGTIVKGLLKQHETIIKINDSTLNTLFNTLNEMKTEIQKTR